MYFQERKGCLFRIEKVVNAVLKDDDGIAFSDVYVIYHLESGYLREKGCILTFQTLDLVHEYFKIHSTYLSLSRHIKQTSRG